MSATKIKFSPSININRDSEYDFNYIVTANSAKVFGQILNDSLLGIKAHVINGAYGTGKSSLLLATKQTLNGFKQHFVGYERFIKQLPNFEFISIVGSFSSLSKEFASLVGINDQDYATKDILTGLNSYYKKLQKNGKGLAILIDEFGKFLEYAAKHNPESELYFIQQLAEWINNTSSQTLLITTVHQGLNDYLEIPL